MTPTPERVTFRHMLRHLLEAYSLSVREAARRAGISPTAVQRYVNGSKPSRVNAGKMAELFDPQDGARLLHEWGFPLAAEKQTHDAEVANGWRLESILGELRNLRKNQVSQLDQMQKFSNELHALLEQILENMWAAPASEYKIGDGE